MIRRTGMRNRVAVLAAVTAFAVGLASVAVLAARSGDDRLALLPSLAGGGESAAADAGAARSLLAREHVEYVIGTALPDLPSEAPAYRLRSSAARRAVERVAKALGIEEPVVERDGRFTSGLLTVEDVPGNPWYLSHVAAGCKEAPVSSDGRSVSVQGCAVSTLSARVSGPGCPPEASCGSTSASAAPTPVAPVPGPAPPEPMPLPRPEPVPMPHPEPVPTPVPGLPDKATAERIAREVFTALGVGVEGLRLDGGYTSWEAVVSPRVGGLEVLGLMHSLSIGPEGKVQHASGYLGTPDRIGDYPLVGTETAFDRLRGGDEGLVDRAGGAPRTVTITDVRLALQHIGDALVPVYLFVADDGTTRPVPGVPDRYLEPPASGHPPSDRPEPGPRPGPGPGAGETGSGMCTGSAAGAAPDRSSEEKNAPLSVSVCVEPAVGKVGQEVVFQVTAIDPDAPISPGGCGSHAVFGDEEGAVLAGCMPACTAQRTKPDPKPGRHTETFRHTYQRAGTYTARFTFQSAACSPYGSTGTGEVTVRVH